MATSSYAVDSDVGAGDTGSTSNAGPDVRVVEKGWSADDELPPARGSTDRRGGPRKAQRRRQNVGEEPSYRSMERELVRGTPESERERIHREHGELVLKKHTDTLNRAERCRLALLTWEIERLRDAEVGPQLDGLEAAVAAVRSLAREVNNYTKKVVPESRGRRKSK